MDRTHTAIIRSIPKTPICAFVSSRNKTHLKRKLYPNKRIKKINENYGELSQKPDVPEEIYLELKDNFLNNLKVKLSSDLERETRGQSLSEKWHHERSKRIFFSFFKEIADRWPTTSCANLVQRIIYKSHFETSATKLLL